MAKKTEITVEEKLRALFDLQLIDSRIDQIRSIRGELPLEVEDLENEITGLNKKLEGYQEEVAQSKVNISIIIKQSKVPVIIDAGIGTASDATIAMEMGCDGVLINSAIANAKNPILMAQAFKNAVISGREAFLSGRMKKNYFAEPSSPTEGLI